MAKCERFQCPAMLQLSGLGPYGLGVCNSVEAIKQGQGEPRECGQTPHNTQSINSQHSLPDPDPKLTHRKAARRKGWQQVASVPFLNPDPIACLVGHSNKASVVIDRQEVTALID